MTPLATSTFLQVLLAAMIILPVLILWVSAVVDVFRRSHSGLKLAAMLVLILILPLLGPLVYFAIRGPDTSSAENVRLADESRRQEAAHRPIGGTGMYR